MGQRAYALLWGIKPPEGVNFHGESYDERGAGLLSLARKRWSAEIAEINKARKSGWEDPTGDDEYIPATPYEADPDLIGFYVAVGGHDEAGIPYLSGFPLDDVQSIYGDALEAAKKRWERFAFWALAEGVALPEAQLWLTET